MTEDEQIADRIEESGRDMLAMQSLFDSQHHTWPLFVGHRVLEWRNF